MRAMPLVFFPRLDQKRSIACKQAPTEGAFDCDLGVDPGRSSLAGDAVDFVSWTGFRAEASPASRPLPAAPLFLISLTGFRATASPASRLIAPWMHGQLAHSDLDPGRSSLAGDAVDFIYSTEFRAGASPASRLLPRVPLILSSWTGFREGASRASGLLHDRGRPRRTFHSSRGKPWASRFSIVSGRVSTGPMRGRVVSCTCSPRLMTSALR